MQIPFAPAPRNPGRRVSPIRKKRRRDRALIALIALVFVSGIAYGVSYVSYLPRYTVQSVRIVGAQAIPQNVIKDYVESIIYDGSIHFFSRANIFLFPRNVIERDLVADFPRIAEAQVAGAGLFDNSITVTVRERQPYALWCGSAGACYQMDATGFIFAASTNSASSTMQSSYVFYGAIGTTTNPIGYTFAGGHLQGISAFLQQLQRAGYSPEGATVENDQDFSVPLADGFSIDASFGEDAGQLVKNLQLVLSSDALKGKEAELEYVDLRFGDRVYYKLKGQDQRQGDPS